MSKVWLDRIAIKQTAKPKVLDHLGVGIIPSVISTCIWIGIFFAAIMWIVFLVQAINMTRSVLLGLLICFALGWLAVVLVTYVEMSLIKYYMAFVRNTQQVVSSGIAATLRYAFTDGKKLRFKYCCMYAALVIPLFILFCAAWGMLNIGLQSFERSLYIVTGAEWLCTLLGVILLVGCFYWSLSMIPLFFIIQDTTSDGNRLEPLSFMVCIKKSFAMMKSRKLEMIGFFGSFLGWYFLSYVIFLNFFVGSYFTSSLTLWVDQLIEEDGEIVAY